MPCLGDFHVCLNQNRHSDCRINYIVRTFVEDFKLRLTLVYKKQSYGRLNWEIIGTEHVHGKLRSEINR